MNISDLFDGEASSAKKAKKGRTKKASSMLPGREVEAGDIQWSETGNIDNLLKGKRIGVDFESMQKVFGAKSAGLALPVESGTRVTIAHSVGSLLADFTLPPLGMSGTVVLVRSGGKDRTASSTGVHVLWDDGVCRDVQAQFLRLESDGNKKAAKATAGVRRAFVDFAPISMDFGLSKEGSTDLVHKATNDLWAFRQDGESYVIERLFTESGEPLKG